MAGALGFCVGTFVFVMPPSSVVPFVVFVSV